MKYPRSHVAGSVVLVGVSGVLGFAAWTIWKRQKSRTSTDALTAHEYLIEQGTPLIKLEKLSRILGRSIYVKMESLNPGGTGKDRAALAMIRHAEGLGLLPPPTSDATGSNTLALNLEDPGSTSVSAATMDSISTLFYEAMKRSRSGGLVIEGTSGSTGIALACLCQARGHACLVVLPDDQAIEKQKILRSLGAVVHVVPTAAISNPNHYVNIARRAADAARGLGIDAVFIDQFENEANYTVHYDKTGPEIMRQCPRVDAFVMSAGTGGTIAGVGRYLRDRRRGCEIVLVDPPGSALHNKVQHGVAYTLEQAEQGLRKHRYDTIAEGIGLDRVTHNFALGLDSVTDSVQVSDQEAVDMAHWILQVEGLWVGSSSAMNLVGAIRTALKLPERSNIVTMICDGGQRHATRFWNHDFVQKWGLVWPETNGSAATRTPACLAELADAC